MARKPGYAAKLLELASRAALAPGEVHHAFVTHNDRCKIFRGRACNCSPDIRIVAAPPETVAVQSAGTMGKDPHAR